MRSKKKKHEWHGRSELVTYDVFKRMYWPHLCGYSMKGFCTCFALATFYVLTSTIKRRLSHLAKFLVCPPTVPRFPTSDFYQGPSRDLRNHWIIQTALLTARHMRILRTRTECHTRCSRRTKTSSSSAVSATSPTGALHCIAYSYFILQLLPNVRTHTLLNGLKENGLKGELIDFVWVDFTVALVDLVTN
jgi:hypothetical protein